MANLPALPAARPDVFRASARGMRPDPVRTCWEWAEEHRIVPPESGSPVPGPYRVALVPYLREPMEVMSLSHPAERVTFKKSAQVGASDATLNLIGQVMTETPAPIIVVTPSIDISRKYNKSKLDPMITSSPVFKDRVDEIKSRDADSSTQFEKGFTGGRLWLVGANASKALQMISARIVVYEELSEYPEDTDGRGSPEDQALERTQAWSERGIKVVDCSTPGLGGKKHDGTLRCRVTALYQKSSRGRFYVRCPHCDHQQTLSFDNLHYQDEAPEAATYTCAGSGCVIEHHQKEDMVAAGEWIHEHPEMVNTHAGYEINALYSPFISWARIARRIIDAKGDHKKEKVVSQQIKGEPYEERHDVPSEEVLFNRREAWPAAVPPGVLYLEGATDCQGDRLQGAVFGFDRHGAQFLVETFTIIGRPTELATWKKHDAWLNKSWPTVTGREMRPISWGIDTGYATHHVYRYCRRHSARAEPKVYALDGQGDPRLPPLGSPSKKDIAIDGQKIGAVLLWPVGTYNLKIDVADALRKTEQGPDENGVWPEGAVRFNLTVSRDELSQITAEVLQDVLDRNQQVTGRRWTKLRANELWDCAVYTRALAYHNTAGMTEARWAALEAEINRPVAPQQDMAALWTPQLAATAPPAGEGDAAPAEPPAPPAPPPPPAAAEAEPAAPVAPKAKQAERRVKFERRNWFKQREDRAW